MTIDYEAAVLKLLDLWKTCSGSLSCDPCVGTNVFMHYAVG